MAQKGHVGGDIREAYGGILDVGLGVGSSVQT